MKIFVNICSYRDPLLKSTIFSLMDNESGENEVTYGVFEQAFIEESLEGTDPDLISLPNVKYKRIDPHHTDGVCWARHINSLQVTDEDFYYQTDSHMQYDYGWDKDFIEDWSIAENLHDTYKIIITANCYNYHLNRNGEIITDYVTSKRTTRSKYCFWSNDICLFAHGEQPISDGQIYPAIHIFAGNFFTHTRWLEEVGINPKIYWNGEEQSLVLSSFAAGWHIYHPRYINCYHYSGSQNHSSKPWNNLIISSELYQNKVERGLSEFRRFLDSLDPKVFNDYYEYSGVDYVNRIIDDRAYSSYYDNSITQNSIEEAGESESTIIIPERKKLIKE